MRAGVPQRPLPGRARGAQQVSLVVCWPAAQRLRYQRAGRRVVIGLVQGNALTIPLADKSVHCIVTSPPYWGLRSYAGTATWEGGAEGCDHEAARHKNRFDYPLQEDSIVYQGTNAG